MSNLILALDSSERELSICLCSRADSSMCLSASAQGSESFYSLLEAALKELSAGLEDISLMVCNLGPGSFVGLRAGLATAYGFSLATKLPSWAISAGFARVWNAFSNNLLGQTQISEAISTVRQFELYQPANRNENFYSRFTLTAKNTESLHGRQVWTLSQEGPWTSVSREIAGSWERGSDSVVLEVEQYSKFRPQSASALAKLALDYQRGELLLLAAPIELHSNRLVEPVYVKPVNALSLEQRRLRGTL